MELRHLRYFVAVAEELHFRRAAERLHIVQPALSKQVSALEGELGLRLLERDRRHVMLTEAGRAFYDEAVGVLAMADAARSRALAVAGGQVGYLTIGFVQPALAKVVPEALRSFRRAYPDVRIRLTEVTTLQALERFAAGTIDCAFLRLPLDAGPDLQVEQVSREDVVAAVPEGHRLAGRESIELSDLADESLILIDRRVEPQLHDYYVSLCREAGFSPKIDQEVNSTWVATGLVASGLGVALVSESVARSAPRGAEFVPISGGPAQLTLGLVWSRRAPSAVLQNFLSQRAGSGSGDLARSRPAETP